MPVTKTITLYTFDELSDKAKENARQWWREGYDNREAYEQIKYDASEIGLVIEGLDYNRPNEGHFETSALDCANFIIQSHGESCETHKTASSYLHTRAKIIEDYDEGESYSDVLDEADKDFLYSLLEDYRVMYDKEVEYHNSDENVDECIKINEYTFTKDGKRESV